MLIVIIELILLLFWCSTKIFLLHFDTSLSVFSFYYENDTLQCITIYFQVYVKKSTRHSEIISWFIKCEKCDAKYSVTSSGQWCSGLIALRLLIGKEPATHPCTYLLSLYDTTVSTFHILATHHHAFFLPSLPPRPSLVDTLSEPGVTGWFSVALSINNYVFLNYFHLIIGSEKKVKVWLETWTDPAQKC